MPVPRARERQERCAGEDEKRGQTPFQQDRDGDGFLHEEAASEKQRLERTQAEVAELLKAKSPELIVHDLRNALNELALLQAIAGEEQ